jgi:uncharacterized protein (DUF2235 family)
LDEAVAWYLYQHVQDGYLFLMQNYQVGDKIHLFGAFGTFPEDEDLIQRGILGFSRGAYTARALAGMLYKV